MFIENSKFFTLNFFCCGGFVSKDHWVSKLILKSFAVNGNVRVHDKKSKNIFSASPNNICAEKGFTTFKSDQVPPGMDGSFLEKELSRWESDNAATVRKLIQHRSINAVSPDDFWELVRFAVWLNVCNPANRDMLSKGWNDCHISAVKSFSSNDLDKLSLKHFGILLPHSHLRKGLENAAKQETLLQSEFLGMVLKSAESSFNIVREEYAWILFDYSKVNLSLCTSDRPVLLATNTLDGVVGFGTPEATLYFPLSPDLCLAGRNVGKAKRFIDDQSFVTDLKIASIPRLLMWGKSSRFIIAIDESGLPSRGVDLPRYTPKVIQYGNAIALTQK